MPVKGASKNRAAAAAKTKKFNLQTKKSVELQAGEKMKVRVKFKKNNKKSVRKINKLLGKTKQARKHSNVKVKVKATGAEGTTTKKKKIRLKV